MLIILLVGAGIVALLLPSMVSCSFSSSQRYQKTKTLKIQKYYRISFHRWCCTSWPLNRLRGRCSASVWEACYFCHFFYWPLLFCHFFLLLIFNCSGMFVVFAFCGPPLLLLSQRLNLINEFIKNYDPHIFHP